MIFLKYLAMRIDKKFVLVLLTTFIAHWALAVLRFHYAWAEVLLKVLMFPFGGSLFLWLDAVPFAENAPRLVFDIDNGTVMLVLELVCVLLQSLLYYALYRYLKRLNYKTSYLYIDRKFFSVVSIVAAIFCMIAICSFHYSWARCVFNALMFPFGVFYQILNDGVKTVQPLSMMVGMENSVMNGFVMVMFGLLQGVLFYAIYRLYKKLKALLFISVCE